MLTGVVAGRFPQRELAWDSRELKFNDDQANRLVRRMYRDGWDVAALVEDRRS